MRLIDADALIKAHENICSRSMKFNLDLAPTIDAVEVVRCKDCVHGSKIVKYPCEFYCKRNLNINSNGRESGIEHVRENDYCSKGEWWEPEGR